MAQEGSQLNFSVLADVHMEGNNPDTRRAFIRILQDIKNNVNGNDALVLTGDNTMNGQNIEYTFLCGLINRFSPADRLLLTVGNHDVGNYTASDAQSDAQLAEWQADFNKLTDRFIDYSCSFAEEIDKPYYYTVINGCYFIFLATEALSCNDYEISEAQIEWLDSALARATENNRPAFVFSHHPYYYTATYETEYALENVLTSYPNVICFSGHTHRGVGTGMFGRINGEYKTTLINLPRCTEGGGNEDTGFGAEAEVYGDNVLIRIRNYYSSEWSDYSLRIELV